MSTTKEEEKEGKRNERKVEDLFEVYKFDEKYSPIKSTSSILNSSSTSTTTIIMHNKNEKEEERKKKKEKRKIENVMNPNGINGSHVIKKQRLEKNITVSLLDDDGDDDDDFMSMW